MRKWIDLVENQTQQFLYHGTSAPGLLGILESDTLVAQPYEGFGASLTRSLEIAHRFAKGQCQNLVREVNKYYEREGWDYTFKLYVSENGWSPGQFAEWETDRKYGSYGAVLIFDKQKLIHNFTVNPYSEKGLEDEEEERLLTGNKDDDIQGIIKCIDSIQILSPQHFDTFLNNYFALQPNNKSKIINLLHSFK